MTIQGLSKFLKDRNVPTGRIPLTTLANTQFAIDGNNLCHNRLWGARIQVLKRTNLNVTIPTVDDIMNELISSVLKYLKTLLHSRCVPVVVFDGTAPVAKSSTLEYRRNSMAVLRQQYMEVENQIKMAHEQGEAPPSAVKDQFTKLFKQVNNHTTYMFHQVAKRLKETGIPVIKAKGEGDSVCASLVMEGYCALAISNDKDILAYGCPILVTNINVVREDGQLMLTDAYVLEDILKTLDLNFYEFQTLCICVGCDYNTRERYMGPTRVYDKIKDGNEDDLKSLRPIKFDECIKIFQHRPVTTLIDEEESTPFIGMQPTDEDQDKMLAGLDSLASNIAYVLLRGKTSIASSRGMSYDGRGDDFENYI